MVSYRIEWKRSAIKELKKLPPNIIKRFITAADSLAENPFPSDSKKLIGSHHTYRIREGSYRLIYNVLTDTILIEIIKVGHRKDVYR